MILKRRPVLPASQTPMYSNMAYQLLAYAVENITGQAFPAMVEENLIKPLRLTRTFLSPPLNDTDAVTVDGWTIDLGGEAPYVQPVFFFALSLQADSVPMDLGSAGGYVQSVTDLSQMGRSILNSTLLPKLITREWLKPVSHTSSPSMSVGRPWEILRQKVPAAPSSNATRLVDVYSKDGGIGQYASMLNLSPDHQMGISILAGGPAATLLNAALQEAAITTWLPAAEHAAREQAHTNLAATYSSRDNSSAEVTLLPDEPGLFLASLVSNGTDMFDSVRRALGEEAAPGFGGWLYPTTLVGSGGGRAAFRAVYGGVGRPAGEPCLSWVGLDQVRYGGHAADLLIFRLGEDGKATAVEIPILQKTLIRAG